MEYIKCPRCELNYIKEEEKFCSSCLSEINNKKRTRVQTINGKGYKLFQEYFTFKNIMKSYRGKTGFVALNSENEEIGIVFMCDDKRTPSFENCELCIYSKFQNRYGEWHRIKSNGERIRWEHLEEILKSQGLYKVYVD